MTDKILMKFQRSIATSECAPQVLVYDEENEHEGMFACTPELHEIFDEVGDKFFAYAIINEKGEAEIDLDDVHGPDYAEW